MPHKLRIAVTVFFGLLTVALCVLWVRSQSAMEVVWVKLAANLYFSAGSAVGELWVVFPHESPNDDSSWTVFSREFESDMERSWAEVPGSGFDYGYDGGHYVVLPHWFAVMFVAGAMLATGLCPLAQFSLRTLLIATTLLALVLGLGVWLPR